MIPKAWHLSRAKRLKLAADIGPSVAIPCIAQKSLMAETALLKQVPRRGREAAAEATWGSLA